MNKRMFFVLAFVAVLVIFGPAAHAAQITGASWQTDTAQHTTYLPDCVSMTWGQLPESTTVTAGDYTFTAKGTGTANDPYRFEASPEITIPSGTGSNFILSNSCQNLLEFRDWAVCLVQPKPAQGPEPSIPAMLLVGLVMVSIYRSRSN